MAGILTALARGGVTQAIARGVGSMTGAVWRGLTGMNEQTASRVGQFLMSAEPQEIRKLGDLFRLTEEAAARPSRAVTATIAGSNAPRHPAERREERPMINTAKVSSVKHRASFKLHCDSNISYVK